MTDLLLSAFEEVWKAYPRKVGKGAARKAWAKLSADAELLQKILAALAWQRQQPQWLKDGGAFIPHLSTYLNQERWLDEPTQIPHLTKRTTNNLTVAHQWANRPH